MADNVVDSLAIEIEANASQSVDGIKRLSRALTSLATSTAKVNSAGLGNVVSQGQRLSSVTTSAGTGATNASNGTRKYSNALNLLTSSSGRAEKSTKSLAYYFGKIYANCFLAIRGFKAIGNAVNSAMDYILKHSTFLTLQSVQRLQRVTIGRMPDIRTHRSMRQHSNKDLAISTKK